MLPSPPQGNTAHIQKIPRKVRWTEGTKDDDGDKPSNPLGVSDNRRPPSQVNMELDENAADVRPC